MNEEHILKIAKELALSPHQVRATGALLGDGATVPFIARYRKEATGTLDEVAITAVRDRLHQLEELDKRRESILNSLKERELLTEELKDKVLKAETLSALEDIYLPFRPKRRTRATMAKEKGLEPLADILIQQEEETDPRREAGAYVDPEKGVENEEQALAGARDILAERFTEDTGVREAMRGLFRRRGAFESKVIQGKEAEGAKFRDYFEWKEPVEGAPSHRVLAMRRGEKEGVLDLNLRPPEEEALAILEGMFVKGESAAAKQIREAVEDCYKRLLSYSMETEIRLDTKRGADAEAIRIFADNLRELLLAPALGQKSVMAIDPGIRTGCKIACLDPQGKLLHTDTIYPFRSEGEKAASAQTVLSLFRTYRPEAVAIGNGTAGRETEAFIRGLSLEGKCDVVMVNESGASVYSASEVARGEFPDLDVSYRGAVSIGRRLMDPLAELVKIDPKSIGVGQYQHDVNQHDLKARLDDVVMSCVNAVGVEVNTASEQLLTYVSGLGPTLARNIVTYRNQEGPLAARRDLIKVPRLGPKAFEQAAGFLRIRGGEHPLDGSAVHPESYPIVEKMARDLGCALQDLLTKGDMRSRIRLEDYVTDTVGLPTLEDILKELARPGRDPRKKFENVTFAEGVETLDDLQPGMRLSGVVTNVTAFGAFVDIGVHQDGLVHISQLSDRFVKDPNDVVRVHQQVEVTVLDVDLHRKRISLTMKENPDLSQGRENTGGKRPAKRDGGRKQAGKQEGPRPFNNPFQKAFKGR